MNNNINNPSNFVHQDPEETIDLRRYLGLFLSNWYWFALTLFISGVIAYGINTYSEKVYTVSASILINNDQSSDMAGLDKIVPGGDIFKSQQNLQNEIGILKSFDVNLKAIEELPEFLVTIVGVGRRGIAQVRHYKSAPFIIKYDSLSAQKTNLKINLKIKSSTGFSLSMENANFSKAEYRYGEKICENGFNFYIIKRDSIKNDFDVSLSNRFVFWFNRPEALANEYRSKLRIEPVNEDATLVNLSVSGVVKLQEAEYLNQLMSVYDKHGLEYKNNAAVNTIKFIDEQLKVISESLSQAEDTLEHFRNQNKIIDLSSEGTTIKNRLEGFNKEKIQADLQKEYFDYLSDYINKRDLVDDIVSPSLMGVSDPVLIKLVQDLADLQNSRKKLKYDLIGNQPAITLIDSKIDDVRKALTENVQSNLLIVERMRNDINGRIAMVESELEKLPGKEKKLINIQRTYDLNNTVYTYMLEKKSEADIAKASASSGNRIIDKAQDFNAILISPKKNRNFMIAIILGLLAPLVYILIIDQMHNKIIDKKDIEKGTSVPIIGFVGHNTTNSEIPLIVKPGSSLSESFRSIRTNLKFYLKDQKKAVIAVTSTLSGEGKTFISLNLAASLALLGKKTLVVGVDLRRPRLNKILKADGVDGLSSFLVGESDLRSIISETTVKNLWFVPSGPIPPNPSELLESERMKLFMDQVKNEFEYIVLDTPPVGIVSDALLLESFSDINIFVIRQRFSFKNTLEQIQRFYERNEFRNLTIAVNDIHISGYYGYGLRYGYGFYEGYGYNYGYGNYSGYKNSEYKAYYTED
jgi:tyrosine-protein kinase Etk/Wzc